MSEPTDSSAPPGESTNPATDSNAPAVETEQPPPQNVPLPVETHQPSAEANQDPPQPTESAPEQPVELAPPAPPTEPTELAAPEEPARAIPPPSDPTQDVGTYQPEETSQPTHAPDLTLPSVESSLPTIDSSLPPMDTSHAFDDSDMNSFDALPSIGSSAAPDMSLPAIDTTLPSLDHSLPAIGTDDIPTMDGHDFGDDSHLDHHDPNSGMADSTGHGHDTTQHHGAVNGGSHYHAQTNGTYQYSHSPVQSQPGSQQSPQTHTQHQFQAQPQQHYQQNDMYHNSGAQGQVPQAPIGSPLPNNMPPMASMGQYMAGYPSNMGQGNAQMRYQLPGDPNKMLSGNRHKKEVKRRTKTGCLTCRKRRIKCDEAHPVCRNCVKSKRECLGYDPVFRTQASTPSAIQPAPNPPPSLVVNPQGPSTSSAPSYPSYPSAPPGYMPASSQPFAPSLHSESPSASTDQHEHGASIDSSLATSNQTNHTEMQNTGAPRQQGSEPSYKAKNLYINDLFSLRGIAPPPPHPVGTLPPGRLEEIQAVFLATYAPAIDKLLEVRWYSESALSLLMADAQLMADYSALINAFNEWNLQDGETLARLESFEASIIWKSMALCRQVPDGETGQQGRDWNLCVACARLNVVEALLTWNHLDSNPLSRELVMDAANPPNTPDQFQSRQLDFWDQVGEFLTLYDNEASSAKQIDDTLGRCRQLLDTYENRDIIYSISVARHLGQRWADFPNSLPKVGYTTEKEAGTKLFVAQKFLEEEAEGKGTTQIYKRVCCMAVRSWWVARG
ncbi:transcriptional regulator family: Fungal Specific TF [Penicillium paradoxum]|uniref:transcriptional regulator family: Fungal Specific TF n=1 Tax=Penicillium paradoxum TaxID=176176 RepID=UPI002546FFFF|nr:transcriptional regulator family: Fungal Specific TF [Penicillium paradoxum]KAJ5779506.1 transcriptional regulator family: Fungal Specific TF [Penicillium paradoxum]